MISLKLGQNAKKKKQLENERECLQIKKKQYQLRKNSITEDIKNKPKTLSTLLEDRGEKDKVGQSGQSCPTLYSLCLEWHWGHLLINGE